MQQSRLHKQHIQVTYRCCNLFMQACRRILASDASRDGKIESCTQRGWPDELKCHTGAQGPPCRTAGSPAAGADLISRYQCDHAAPAAVTDLMAMAAHFAKSTSIPLCQFCMRSSPADTLPHSGGGHDQETPACLGRLWLALRATQQSPARQFARLPESRDSW